jgi:hypothetical protein
VGDVVSGVSARVLPLLHRFEERAVDVIAHELTLGDEHAHPRAVLALTQLIADESAGQPRPIRMRVVQVQGANVNELAIVLMGPAVEACRLAAYLGQDLDLYVRPVPQETT